MESIGNQHLSLKATLDAKKGHRRTLLMYVRDNAQHFSIEQQEELSAYDEQMAEHELDMVVLVASEVVEPDRQYLMNSELNLTMSEEFVGWLIGKDGAIQHRFNEPVSPDELKQLIDNEPKQKVG